MNNWFDQLLVWDMALAPNEYMKFGTKDMLVESVFGWGKHCCRLVCCHGNGVAHSLNVSTSLSFFPREYGEAFKELCNSGTVMPVPTRTKEMCRTLKNVCTP